jgi:hypothetical protein
MKLVFRAAAAGLIAMGAHIIGANAAKGATRDHDFSGHSVSAEDVKVCRNANTLIFQRASFFNQTHEGSTVFPAYGYERRPQRGLTVSASSISEEDGRAATASLNHACEIDPSFRLKNPAEESNSYVGVKPRLDSPRAPR